MRWKFPLILTLFLGLLSSSAEAQFGAHFATHFGYGKMGSDSGFIQKRSMGTFDLQAMPGYRLLGNQLLLGLLFDLRFMSQLQDQNDVGGEDFGGRGLTWGLGASFEPGPVKILVSYDLSARHWYTAPETTYKGSGFHFILGIPVAPSLFLDLQYVTTTYNTRKVNGDEYGLADDNVQHWNVGFGVSYSY